jgi:hypothetical protein
MKLIIFRRNGFSDGNSIQRVKTVLSALYPNMRLTHMAKISVSTKGDEIGVTILPAPEIDRLQLHQYIEEQLALSGDLELVHLEDYYFSWRPGLKYRADMSDDKSKRYDIRISFARHLAMSPELLNHCKNTFGIIVKCGYQCSTQSPPVFLGKIQVNENHRQHNFSTAKNVYNHFAERLARDPALQLALRENKIEHIRFILKSDGGSLLIVKQREVVNGLKSSP